MAPRQVPLLPLLLLLSGCHAELTYHVYRSATNPTCDPAGQAGLRNALPEAAAAGTCVNFGMGASAFNSVEVISCSSRCLCFTQYASEGVDSGCDPEAAAGSNVKQACFGECLADCNGSGCGATATLESAITRLAMEGEGQLCAEPLPDEEYSCATTGMVQAPADANNGTIAEDDGGDAKSGTDNTSGAAASRPPPGAFAAGALLALLMPLLVVFNP